MIAPHLLVLGIKWMDPEWLLQHFHTEFIWLSLAIVFVECGLFFPFLPGDTLLFAIGLFIAGDKLSMNLPLALVAFIAVAFAGNVVGYEIGRRLGPPLRHREGRLLKRKYFDQTDVFFERHGNKALVIGRFVPFVRTFITIIAGVIQMPRHRFFVWSGVGAVLWVLAITLLGYFLGNTVPWLANNIDYATLAILVFSALPILWEWRRHRRTSEVSS